MSQNHCRSCAISQGHEQPLGRIIVNLEGGWTLNHYGDKDSFLGRMALQPREHRMELADLTLQELEALGRNIQRIDLALTHYFDCHFGDKVERVYIVYFFESYHDNPKKCEWHLHIHLIPRTEKMRGNALPTEVAAWNIHKITKRPDFPAEYRIEKDNDEAVLLMKFLKLHLER
jgi:diadenosine tetraphosphate (Ap4A) HIT family hydrolase